MKKPRERKHMQWALYDQPKDSTIEQLTATAKQEFEDMTKIDINIINSQVIQFAGRTTLLDIIYEIAKKSN